MSRRWRQSSGLRAQIGAGVDGVVTIDLREDGPHGLVAGTTGSGKSELLQSLICSLALNNPPSRMNFLLVDYKGGAAFRECADLPHTVGYITDLTPALVQRALTSLGAEIASREHLLGQYGVKDLVQLERERPDVAPPSLLICVDEFAALTAEVPEFVDGMVNIAQRGRSLGMHVLLATQRPAGRGDRQHQGQRRPADLAARLVGRRLARRHRQPRGGPHLASYARARVDPAHRPRHGRARAVGLDRRPAADGRVGGARAGQPVQRGRPSGAGDDGRAPEQRLNPRTDLERCVHTINEAFLVTGAEAAEAAVAAGAALRAARSTPRPLIAAADGPHAAAGSSSAASTSRRPSASPS